ncbi:MAG: zinc ribbon domain-containing protein [Gemmatimonadetes bacterium]|nr:zinc ribbon domain-containing protein [Gemmatimonadota bacterium]MBI3082526.1 zinc ribbon domain-containing protein [Gemmatimonadota bacterium]
MPTYQYRCPSCGHEFEKFEKITAKTRPKCPQCDTRAERMISGGAGLLFKGSGFYITDYKKPGKEKPAEGEKPAKPEKPDKKKPSTPSSSGAE